MWLEQYVGIYHRLYNHFPNDRGTVESYFRPRKGSSGEEVEDPTLNEDVDAEEEDDGEDDDAPEDGLEGAADEEEDEGGLEEVAGSGGLGNGAVPSDTELL